MDSLDLQPDIAERLLKPAFRLGPFAFRAELEKNYRAELNPEAFAKEISEELTDISPSRDTIDFLYETCFEARMEKELMVQARTIARKGGWRESRKKLSKLIEGLRGYKNIDLETRLRKELEAEGYSITGAIAARLHKQLVELNWACECWEGFANWATWKRFYRGYVWNMDRSLRRSHSKQEDGDHCRRCSMDESRVPRLRELDSAMLKERG